jgi:hypothetical protein
MHFHSIEDGPARNPTLIAGLDYALKNEYGDVSPRLQARVAKLYADSALVHSELWVRTVYGYFRNCYAPESGSRNVADCIIIKADDDEPPPERHLGYLMVKEYFPDAEPRLDLIADSSGGYGSQPCAKCGVTLQYEARVDAFAEAITAKRDCPKGGVHERP